jgi:asparagine synthase (glutamine-hydrolysing)
MCGITGAIWTDSNLAVDRATLQRMTDVLRHRGPDGEGAFTSQLQHQSSREPQPGVALGHRRLAIIDVAGSPQPMSNEDESMWLVFNGEIYNYLDLHHRLDGSGHRFKTAGDTETILHLFEDEGPSCFRVLNGMFALALYDAKHRRLVLARDRFGKKPLYYRAQGGRLAFASEIKSLLCLPDASREIDPAAIDAYLTYQYIPPPRSIYKDIQKLPPGHSLTWRDGQIKIEPYWSPDWSFERSIGKEDAIERIRELFYSAVRLRLQSEVPLGAFLSGGIDSSLVCAVAQSMLSQPLQTFSIGFSEKEFDESEHAQRVANHLKTDHHAFRVTPKALEILPQLVEAYDEPFADSSAIPTWYVSELTRKDVTVALSGDGGDEVFLGYERYRAVELGRRLDRTTWLKRLLASPLWQRLPARTRQRSLVRRFKRFSESIRKRPVDRYLDWICIFKETDRAALYRDEFLAELPPVDPGDYLRDVWAKSGNRDPMAAAANTDLQTYLPCDLMTKVDIASMAHSLEVRQPFLDYRLVEYCASLSKGMRFQWGKPKPLLREAFGDLLPAATWNRAKMGFGVPLAKWFRGELKEYLRDSLLGDHARSHQFFSKSAMEGLIRAHESQAFDHSHRLWSLLFLEVWLQKMAS